MCVDKDYVAWMSIEHHGYLEANSGINEPPLSSVHDTARPDQMTLHYRQFCCTAYNGYIYCIDRFGGIFRYVFPLFKVSSLSLKSHDS